MNTYPQVESLRAPRELTPPERQVLRNLMRRKFYDLNHPEEGRRYPILARAFVPADHRGNPCVVLLCQHWDSFSAGRTTKERFDFVVFSDGLYGRGHYASDKFGYGGMAVAQRAFEGQLVYEVLGAWPWVINKVRKDAHKIVKSQGTS